MKESNSVVVKGKGGNSQQVIVRDYWGIEALRTFGSVGSLYSHPLF